MSGQEVVAWLALLAYVATAVNLYLVLKHETSARAFDQQAKEALGLVKQAIERNAALVDALREGSALLSYGAKLEAFAVWHEAGVRAREHADGLELKFAVSEVRRGTATSADK